MISDTDNHCIKIFDIVTKKIYLFFGTCGLAGFKDGFSYNTLLNKPTQLGYDRLGNVYVNDRGNNHI